jgi:hypothetical protein
MTPDEITMPEAEVVLEPDEADTERAMATARRKFEGPALDATMSAIASARTESLKATASAVAFARVDGTAEARLSQVSMAYVTGDLSLRQCYTSAFVAGNEVSVSQGLAPVAVARTISFDKSANCVTLASDAKVEHGFVGVLLSGRSEISENSRVLITGRGLVALAIAVLSGFGLVALAVAFGANRMSQWQPSITLPSWSELRDRF